MRYEEYKESNISWVPLIPLHWDAIRGKNLYNKENRAVRDFDETVTCFRDGEVTLRKNRRTEGFTESLKESGYQGIRKGDLVIHVMDAFAGSIGVSDSDGKGTPVYSVCTAKRDLSNYYYAYLLREMARTGFIQSLYRGIRERSSDFRFDIFAAQRYPVPPREEQDQIVRYLDWKVSCINKLIHGYQRQIKLLEERRRSVVESYILKDCNEYRTMALHYAVEFIVDCPHETPLYDLDGCYYVIRTADEGYGELRTDDAMYKLQEEEYKKRTRRAQLNKGDIVYGREGERWGLACLVPESNKYCLGQRMIQIRCNTKFLLPEYAVWLLNANYVYQQGYVEILGSTSPHVNVATIGSYRIKVPSLDKQKEIAAYINTQMNNINDAVRHIEKEIALLEEYRTRLISDVVTGQMDVRGVAVPEYVPESDEEGAELDETLSNADEETEV